MPSKGTAPARVAHSLPDCQASLQNEIIKFSWLHNAEVSVTMLSSNSVHLAPAKFKTLVNIQERSNCSSWLMQTVADRMILCFPWFGDRLIVTRTRPIEDQLAKIGFGGII